MKLASVRAAALAACACVACPLPSPLSEDAERCNVIVLPPLPGHSSTRAEAIGPDDVVVGRSDRTPVEWWMLPEEALDEAEGLTCDREAAVGGRVPCVHPLPLPGSAGSGVALDVDDEGRVVGGLTPGESPAGAVRWSAPQPTGRTPELLPAGTGGIARAVSGSGTVVGRGRAASGFIAPPGVFTRTDLVDVTDSPEGVLAVGVRGTGAERTIEIVGVDGRVRAVVATGEQMGVHGITWASTKVRGQDGSVGSRLVGPVVVGFKDSRPVLWDFRVPAPVDGSAPATSWRDAAPAPQILTVWDGTTDREWTGEAFSVRPATGGVSVVGSYRKGGYPRAFRWRGAGRDLDDEAWEGCGITLEEARDESAAGVVVGNAVVGGQLRGFVLPSATEAIDFEVKLLPPRATVPFPRRLDGERIVWEFEITNASERTLELDLRDRLPGGARLSVETGAPNETAVAADPTRDLCARNAWTETADREWEARVSTSPGAVCRVELASHVVGWGTAELEHADYTLSWSEDGVVVERTGPPQRIELAGGASLVKSASPLGSCEPSECWADLALDFEIAAGTLGEPAGSHAVFLEERLPEGFVPVLDAPLGGAPGLDCAVGGAHAWQVAGDHVRARVLWGAPPRACRLHVRSDADVRPGDDYVVENPDHWLTLAGDLTLPGTPGATLEVTRPNRPPDPPASQSPVGCAEADGDGRYELSVQATDPDGHLESVTFRVLTPDGQWIDFAGTPRGDDRWAVDLEAQEGTYCVAVVVDDGHLRSSSSQSCFEGRDRRYALTWLSPHPGGADTRAFAANETGRVVGGTSDDPCVWEPNGSIDCPSDLVGYGPALDVNEEGAYVGHTTGPDRGFVATSDLVCRYPDDAPPLAARPMAISDGRDVLAAASADDLARFRAAKAAAEPGETRTFDTILAEERTLLDPAGWGKVDLWRVIGDPDNTCDDFAAERALPFGLSGESSVPGLSAPECRFDLAPLDRHMRYRNLSSTSSAWVLAAGVGQQPCLPDACGPHCGVCNGACNERFTSPLRTVKGPGSPFDPVPPDLWLQYLSLGLSGRNAAVTSIADLDGPDGNRVWVVGYAPSPGVRRAVAWDATLGQKLAGPIDLVLPGPAVDSVAWDANATETVGFYDTDGSSATAVAWFCGGQQVLPLASKSDDPTAILSQARAVTEAGTIVGFGVHQGATRGFRLDPITPPAP